MQPTTENGVIIVLLATNLFQLILQIAQMFFNNKQNSKDLLIKDLQDRITNLENNIINLENNVVEERAERKKLEEVVFTLKEENAYLSGQLKAQQRRKEDLAEKI